jgi:hypothetical protein
LLGFILLQSPAQFVSAKPWLDAWRNDLKGATLDEKTLVLLCDALDFLQYSGAVSESGLAQYLSVQAEQGRSQTLMPWLQTVNSEVQNGAVLPAIGDAQRMAASLRHTQLQGLLQQAASLAGQSPQALADYKNLSALLKLAQAAAVERVRAE